jgi:Silicon transporter
LMNTRLAHDGDNLDRYIVGRQFLVVLIVFCTNMIGTAISGASVLGLPNIINEIFLSEGLAMIIVTIIIGMLIAQVIAADCMLDFLNNYVILSTTYLALAVEKCGLLHCVYLVTILFSKITGKEVVTKEPSRSRLSSFFFWFRVFMSFVLVTFSFAVTISALFQGETKMWNGVPNIVSVILFLILMCVVGILEGMQIALFEVINLPKDDVKKYPVVYANCKLAFRDQNLKALLIGRQICVTCCMFVAARITSINVDINDPNTENIFGVSDSVQNFLNTGLLGAVITTIFGSLAWRIIASSFPIGFLSNPVIYLLIQLCLIVENTGVCSAAWILGRYTKRLAGFQPDHVYLGGVEALITYKRESSRGFTTQSCLPV